MLRDRCLLRVRQTKLDDVFWPPSSVDPEPLPVPNRDIIEKLEARRIVLVSGDRFSGRTNAAFSALADGFGDYVLLRPKPVTPGGTTALEALLTQRLVGWFGPHALWLGDLGGELDAGLDPRLVERWLATGRKRVAIGTITPADFKRHQRSRPAIGAALDRVELVPVDAPGSSFGDDRSGAVPLPASRPLELRRKRAAVAGGRRRDAGPDPQDGRAARRMGQASHGPNYRPRSARPPHRWTGRGADGD